MADSLASSDSSGVLIVEDEGLIGLRLERLLTSLGYQVTAVAPTGEEALESVEAHPPDLVLMDVDLSDEVDGIETATRIREQLDVPIVYLSAYPEQIVMDEVKHTQPYGVLAKPVQSKDLTMTVEMAIHKHRMERRLRESEKKYRLLAENVEDVIWQTNATLDAYTYVSPSVTRLLGYTSEEMVAMPFLAHLAPGSHVEIEEAIDRRLAAEQAGRGDDDARIWELEYLRKDGTIVWVESTTRPLRDDDGIFLGLVGVARDITKRKRAEQALYAGKTILSEAEALAQLGSFEWDIASGVFSVSEGWQRIHGCSAETLRMEDLLPIAHPDDLQRIEAALQRSLDYGDRYELEHRIIRQDDGDVRTIQAYGEVVFRGGQPFKMYGAGQDITVRKEMEAALRESEERYRIVSELVSDFAYAFDVAPDGLLMPVWITDAFHQITGYTLDRLQTKESWEALFHPADRVFIDHHIAVLRGGHPQQLTLRIITKDGETRWIHAYNRPEIDAAEDRVTRIYGAAQDVTRQKLVEDALRESDDRYRLFFDNAGIGIGYYTVSGRVISLNKVACRYLGGNPQDFVGKSILDLFGKQAGGEYLERIQAAARADDMQEYEDQVGLTQGDRWFLSNYTAVRDAAGGVVGVQIVSYDITDRKRTEEALRESEARLQALIDNTEDIIAARDRDFRVTVYNEAFAQIVPRLFGAEAAPGLRTVDYLPEAAKEHWERAIARVLNGERYRESFTFEIDGERRHYDLAFNPIMAVDGEIVGVAEFTHDVTEHKRIEEALRKMTERLRIQHEVDMAILRAQSPETIARSALEHLKDLIPYRRAGVSEIDQGRRRVRDVVSLAWEEPWEALNPQWYALSRGGDIIDTLRQGRAHVVQDLTALTSPAPLEREMRNLGVRSYISAPMFVRDELVGALNLSSDTPNFFQPEHVEILKEIAISLAVAMRQADLFEQTQRDAETKALLLHDVNHRVMNNLEMILSILELEMERLRDQEEVADLVKGVLQDVCGRIHGIAIVHRLISNVERETLEPGNVVDRVIHAALGGSPIHDLITVMIDVADDVPPLSAKQAVALALITNELTTNSIKYAFADRSQGEIRVQIDCIDARGEEQKLRFLFRDDGPGLPEPEPAVEAKSMGLWLIRASATGTLRGEVEFRNDDGAVVEVRFPVESTQARAP